VKKAPPYMAFEPRTLELVRAHRRFLIEDQHPGSTSELLFPSERDATRPTGNDQLNDVLREAQADAGIERPISIHGLRHSYHDIARQQGIPDAVVKAMAGRKGSTYAPVGLGTDTHLHYSRGVTIEEMRQASIAVMSIVPVVALVPGASSAARDRNADASVPTEVSRNHGRDQAGRDRTSDGETAAMLNR
jgi:hypothetical protein